MSKSRRLINNDADSVYIIHAASLRTSCPTQFDSEPNHLILPPRPVAMPASLLDCLPRCRFTSREGHVGSGLARLGAGDLRCFLPRTRDL
ncbi:hypothetical protein BaRGS_00025157 [Batillaria attramentaria]|uniref:Uncharacterized protein n=1 Tax=Batillaria attramentaria TaxID=370345 RepID=A0ABD0K941_9CAEN